MAYLRTFATTPSISLNCDRKLWSLLVLEKTGSLPVAGLILYEPPFLNVVTLSLDIGSLLDEVGGVLKF